MYTVSVKDHIMIAHSLPDPYFGPAANMHGATYVIEAIFSSEKLNEHGVVIDIGAAHEELKKIVEKYSYQNLDELEEFRGKLTTTEFLAHHFHTLIRKQIPKSMKLKVILYESHVAYASYED